MLNSALLDMFIGLALIYVLLSLVVAAVIEQISGCMKIRNSILDRAMHEILGEEKFVNLFFRHPVVRCFGNKPFFLRVFHFFYGWKVVKLLKVDWLLRKMQFLSIYHLITAGRPSYLSSNIFAKVIYDLIGGGFEGIKKRYAPIVIEETSSEPGSVNDENTLVLQFDVRVTFGRQEVETWLKRFSYFTEMVDVANTRPSFGAGIVSLFRDQEKVFDRMAEWFDIQMERVSGIYKRKVQALLFLVSIVCCSILNADSIMIASILWNDPVVRSAAVYQATTTVANGELTGEYPAAMVDELNQSVPASNPCTGCGKKTPLVVAAEVTANRPLPVGWEHQKSGVYKELRSFPDNFKGWFYKVVGILITTFLISLGAPFWFDILSKVVNIRNVGIKPKYSLSPLKSTGTKKDT